MRPLPKANGTASNTRVIQELAKMRLESAELRAQLIRIRTRLARLEERHTPRPSPRRTSFKQEA